MATIRVGNVTYDQPEFTADERRQVRIGNAIYHGAAYPAADPRDAIPPAPVLVIDEAGETIPEPLGTLQNEALIADQDPSTDEVETPTEGEPSPEPESSTRRKRRG